MGSARKILRIGTFALWILAYFTLLNQQGFFKPVYKESVLTDISAENGNAFFASVNDSSVGRGNGKIILYEDDQPFVRDLSVSTESVRESGAGRFVVWNDGLICFSSSDGTSPLTNGRTYRIRYPWIPGSIAARNLYRVALLWFAIWILLECIAFLRRHKNLLGLMKANRRLIVAVCVVNIPLLICLFRFMLNQTLWGDETHALIHYCLDANVLFPAMIYDLPNNHIFLDLILSVYLRLIGVSKFCDIALSPWKLRILFLGFTFLTILFGCLSAAKVDRKAVIPFAVELSTAIPFYLWTTQIRGYSLIFALFSMLIYCLLCYRERPRKSLRFAGGLLAALLIYTIPLSALYVGGVMFYYGCCVILSWVHSHAKIHSFSEFLHFLADDSDFQLILAFLGGVLFSLILYFPVSDQVAAVFRPDGFAAPLGENHSVIEHLINPILSQFFSALMKEFLSKRYFLIVIVAVGLFLLFRKRGAYQPALFLLGLTLSVVLIPFLLCGITKYIPSNRHFTPLLLNMILMAAVLTAVCIRAFPGKRAEWILNILLFAACQVCFLSNILPAHEALPVNVPGSLDDVFEPYYMSERMNSNELLEAVRAENPQGYPVIVSWPADFYLYDLCDCHELACSSDYVGAYSQNLIRSEQPYMLIRTADRNGKNAELPGWYQSGCTPVAMENGLAYRLYRCNMP